MLGAHAGGPQMPKAIFGQLVGHQCQDAFAVVLGRERAVAVAAAQVLEVLVEVTHGVPCLECPPWVSPSSIDPLNTVLVPKVR